MYQIRPKDTNTLEGAPPHRSGIDGPLGSQRLNGLALNLPKLGVQPTSIDQLLMCTLLCHSTIRQDNNTVSMRHSAEAMGNDERRLLGSNALQVRLNRRLGGRIQRLRGFVENHNCWLFQDRSRDRDPLFLATR